MTPHRRFSVFRPREYADRLADAMGDGSDAESARSRAGGTGPLRRLFTRRDEDDEECNDPDEESEP